MAAFAGVNQLVRKEKLDRALEEAGKLLEMCPGRSKLHADLGGILYKMGQYDSAVNSKSTGLVTCCCINLVCLVGPDCTHAKLPMRNSCLLLYAC